MKYQNFSECPKCSSEDITWGNYQRDGDVWFRNYCNVCDFDWNEVYTFSHCEDVGGKPIVTKEEE